jgi:hypothetical protein
MTLITSFSRRNIVGWVSSVAVAAGVVAAIGIGIAAPASGADLYTEPAPQVGYQAPPPVAYPAPVYMQPRYVARPYAYRAYGYRPYGYRPYGYRAYGYRPYGYRPYGPAYRPYALAAPYPYGGPYVAAYPRPPAPVVGPPPGPVAAYPPGYGEEVVEAAPSAYGYPGPR